MSPFDNEGFFCVTDDAEQLLAHRSLNVIHADGAGKALRVHNFRDVVGV